MILHDTPAALAFLKLHAHGWSDDWFVQVVAIEPKQERDHGVSPPVARSVRPSKIDGLAKWIEEHQGKSNIYFSVNPLSLSLTNKASKHHIAALTHLHVDLDPRDGQPLEEERERIRATVDAFENKPSAFVDSGNGYGLFYRLDKPVVNTGDPDALEDANKRLAEALGGDHCHNLDRVMRLPGTVNIPDYRKIAKGRVPVLASLLSQSDAAYSLDDFEHLPRSAPKVEPKVEPVNDAALNERLQFAAFDPDFSKLQRGEALSWMKDTSRSGFDFAYAQVLARLNFSDGEIAVALMKFEYGKAAERDNQYVANILKKIRAEKAPSLTPTARGALYLKDETELVAHAGPLKWLIREYVEQDALCQIFGPPGSYKTFIVMGIAFAVASGLDWCGHKVMRQGPVVYICGEGHNGIARRWRVQRQHHNITGKLPIYFSSVAVGLSDAENAARLRDVIDALEAPPVLIVVDTLARNFGPADENSTADMNRFVANIDALRGDATVIVIHHSGHTNTERERGASSLRGAIDANTAVEWKPDLNVVQYKPLKMKDAALPPPFFLSPRVVELAGILDEDGKPATSVVLETGEDQHAARVAAVYQKYPKLGAGERRQHVGKLLSKIYDMPTSSQRELASAAGLSLGATSNLLKLLRGYRLIPPASLELTQEGMEVAAVLTERVDITVRMLVGAGHK